VQTVIPVSKTVSKQLHQI